MQIFNVGRPNLGQSTWDNLNFIPDWFFDLERPRLKFDLSQICLKLVGARGGEGALAQLPRATGSRPNQGDLSIFVFSLQNLSCAKSFFDAI